MACHPWLRSVVSSREFRKDNNDIAGALRYSLKASLTSRIRIGELWVHSLSDHGANYIIAGVCVPEQHAIFKEGSNFSKSDCWNVLHGYLRRAEARCDPHLWIKLHLYAIHRKMVF